MKETLKQHKILLTSAAVAANPVSVKNELQRTTLVKEVVVIYAFTSISRLIVALQFQQSRFRKVSFRE